MNDEQSTYLNARLGIVGSTRHVPYGWEIPEEEITFETRASTNKFSRLGLVSVVAFLIWLVLKLGSHAHHTI
jgi:hypothetical protein